MNLHLFPRGTLPGNVCLPLRKWLPCILALTACCDLVIIPATAGGETDTHSCTTVHWRDSIPHLRKAAAAVWGDDESEWPVAAREAFPPGESTRQKVTHDQVATLCKALEDALWGRSLPEDSCVMRTARIMAALL